MDYTQADALLQGQCKDSSKIGNNTYLIRRDEVIVIRLHNTDIVRFAANGDTTLDTDGWKTVTTKARLNEYLRHIRIWSDKGTWYIRVEGTDYVFEDGMVVHADWTVTGAGTEPDNKIKKRISHYVAGYIAAIEAGKVPAPNAGDCFYCQMREVQTKRPLGEITKDKDHLDSHMKEKYYVPSLLARAMEIFPLSQVDKWWIGSYWDTTADEQTRMSARSAGRDWAKKDIAKVLKRYLLRQYGFQA